MTPPESVVTVRRKGMLYPQGPSPIWNYTPEFLQHHLKRSSTFTYSHFQYSSSNHLLITQISASRTRTLAWLLVLVLFFTKINLIF